MGIQRPAGVRPKKVSAWFGAQALAKLTGKTAQAPPAELMLIGEALALMDNAIDYAALPTVCTMLGLSDIERAIYMMRAVIEHRRNRQ